MENFETSVTLPGTPPEKLFDYISDVRNMKDWVDAVVSNEPYGDPGEGQQFDSLSSFMGLKLRGTQQVLAFERPGHFAWGAEEPFHSRFDAHLTLEGDGTVVTIVAEMETSGIPGGAIVVRRSSKKAINGMTTNLKRIFSEV